MVHILIPDSDTKPLPAKISHSQRLQELAKAISDPLDFRGDEELSEELGFSQKELIELYSDRSFMDTVLTSFQRNLKNMAPFIVKTIMAQAKGGSVGAAKLLLQAAGIASGDSPTVQVNVGSGDQGVRDALATLSEDDLDREIQRLLEDTQASDVSRQGNRVLPVDMIEAEVLDGDDDAAYGSGRDHPSAEEREASQVSTGETEETS